MIYADIFKTGGSTTNGPSAEERAKSLPDLDVELVDGSRLEFRGFWATRKTADGKIAGTVVGGADSEARQRLIEINNDNLVTRGINQRKECMEIAIRQPAYDDDDLVARAKAIRAYIYEGL